MTRQPARIVPHACHVLVTRVSAPFFEQASIITYTRREATLTQASVAELRGPTASAVWQTFIWPMYRALNLIKGL